MRPFLDAGQALEDGSTGYAERERGMERLAGNLMLLGGAKRAVVAFAAGALAVGALPPFDFPAVLFVSFPVLVWLLDGAGADPNARFLGRLKPAFRIGWWFGFGYFVAGLWWVGSALLVEADQFAWFLPLAVLGLPAVLALFYGLAAALARPLWSDGLGRIAALAVGFGIAEWLRSFVLTGFPWNAVGYGAMPVPLMMQSAHVVGLDGMNALTVFVAAAPALIATRRGAAAGLAVAAALVVAHIGYGWYVLASAPAPVSLEKSKPVFRIVQPSIDQSEIMSNAGRNRIFEKYLRLSVLPPEAGGKAPDYIVWPETAVPFILTANPAALTRIGEMLQPGQTLITGTVRVERGQPGDEPRYYNSIDVINDRGEIVDAADKVHLVPFGEYMPYQSFFEALGISPVAMPGGFTAGAERRTLRLTDTLVALPLVCYEVIFPVGRQAEGPPATFILNVTNDAWYGRTPGPYQHLRQAQLRAVETGLPMIRAANDGISVVTDSYGRITAGIRLDDVGVVDATLGRINPSTTSIFRQSLTFWLIIVLLLVVSSISRKGLAYIRN
jgi:apolipoprotein N-acyltransferase